MFGLVRNQTKTTAQTITLQTRALLDELMMSGEGSDQMLQRLGISRKQALDAIVADDEVESCREDLRAAMLAQAWHIYGNEVDDLDIDALWRMVRCHLPVLAEVVLTAKLNGYGVANYVYEKDETGMITVQEVINRSGSITRFAPKADGNLYFDDNLVDSRFLHLLLVNRPTDTQPAGEMAAARLYPAVCLRKQGFLYAAQFITRYAQPYLVAKNESNTDDEHRSFVSRLFGLVNGGAMSINREDEVQLLQNNADGQAFKRLENLANARIQKMLLGKVKTADLESGSRAAQETEEHNRSERIGGYLFMLAQAVQHMLDAVVTANAAWGKTIHAPKGIWFEFKQAENIDTARAERDKIYLDTGAIRFTPEYYRDVLGYDESHFVLAESAPDGGGAGGTKRLSVRLAGGANPQPAPVPTVEQVIMQPKIQAVLSTLEKSASYAEFSARLDALDLSAGDNLLIQRLVADGSTAYIEGDSND